MCLPLPGLSAPPGAVKRSRAASPETRLRGPPWRREIMQRVEGLVRGTRAELKLSLLLTHWPQVHLWGRRCKLRAEQLLGPLLTSAAAALCAQCPGERYGNCTHFPGTKRPAHRPCKLLTPLLCSPPLLGHIRTSATLKRWGERQKQMAQ